MDKQKSPKRNTRQLRDRKERKFYTDDWALGDADDDIEGPQSFDLDEKLNATRFQKNLVRQMRGTDFNLAYIQQNGFVEPVIFKNKDGLGIRIPGPNFCIGDVKTCVGSKRLLDVMDVRTQKNMEMSMKTWQEYYEKEDRDRLLNVISLEFSHTKLENFIEAPTVVRQLDWVDRVWPRHLKNMQTESTNVMDEMMYPKVQKYCLMSVKGCYTDFHVDFGGTSVWYHILKGAKVFWLIPPTDHNLESYQEWVLSGKQGDTFFGDNVEICSRVYLESGDTFFIPSGWIHAVYTPKDSLVFGGNFLHSFGIEKQLKIATVEEQTKVPQKFRYPFFTEMLWYTLERYVHCLLGESFIRIPSDEDEDQKDWKPEARKPQEDVALSPQELLGLKAIVLYLHQLPIQRKNVPALIYDPVGLLRSIREIVEMHRYDNPTLAVTGKPILVWPGERAEDVGKVSPVRRQKPQKACMPLGKKTNNGSVCTDSPQPPSVEDFTRRRTECGKCQACTNTMDCYQCSNCALRLQFNSKDGATATGKCVMKECMAPLLRINSTCSECGLDGWGEIAMSTNASKLRTAESNLMECSLCWVIVHPICIGPKIKNPDTIAIVNDDLPNSWECPICLEKTTPSRPLKRQKSIEEKAARQNNNNSAGINHEALINGNHSTPPTTGGEAGRFASGFMVSKIKEEQIETKSPIKPMIHKSERDDEESVKLRLEEVVRRKSTEEAAAKERGKLNLSLKRTLSSTTGESSKAKRRLSIGNNKDEEGARNSSKKVTNGSKVNNKLLFPQIEKVLAQNIKKELEDKLEAELEKRLDDDKESAVKASPIKYPFRSELSAKIMSSSTKALKKPTNVVRPSSLEAREDELKKSGSNKKLNSVTVLKEKAIWLNVFKWLDIRSLNRVLSVTKDWNRIGMSPELWKKIDLSHRTVTPELLKGIVRRQPSTVILNWTKISRQQLLWLISRLPQLRQLSVQGNPWNSVSALKTSFCPSLEGLDLGYVDNLVDSAVREILAPPLDSRPGLTDSKSRLKNLTFLSLAGAHFSDVALRYVTQHAGRISRLDLSCCPRITDAGIAQLGAPDSPSLGNLTHLYITGCPQLTNICLDHLKRCKNLVYLDIQNIPQITILGVSKFLSQVNECVGSRGRANMIVKHSLPSSQLDIQNLHENFYQSEMISSSNSLTSPVPQPHPSYHSGKSQGPPGHGSGGQAHQGVGNSLIVSIMP